GQYSLYRFMLKKAGIKRELFLAITEKAHQQFFELPAVEEYFSEHQIYLLTFDPKKEEIIKWIK
ncbi:MAG: element excision factor XisH family protein, partial [Blastocatellia bacterium]